MNWATVIVIVVVLALVAWAVYGLRKGKGKGKSSCCEDKKSGCSGCSVDCPFRR